MPTKPANLYGPSSDLSPTLDDQLRSVTGLRSIGVTGASGWIGKWIEVVIVILLTDYQRKHRVEPYFIEAPYIDESTSDIFKSMPVL